jgi:hypothetical protein
MGVGWVVQDTSGLVRQSMCEQLNRLARAVGVKLTVSAVLVELEELLRDEEVEVKKQALLTLVEVLDVVPPKLRRDKVLPVLRAYCQQPPRALLPLVARLFGAFYVKVAEDRVLPSPSSSASAASASASTAAASASASASSASAASTSLTSPVGAASVGGGFGSGFGVGVGSGMSGGGGDVSPAASPSSGSGSGSEEGEPAATLRVFDAFYASLATADDPELRRLCAYNLPVH